MELTYKSKKLKELCENPKYNKELLKKYGSDVAKKLPQRIKQLEAFNSLNDIPINPPFRRHKLSGDREGRDRKCGFQGKNDHKKPYPLSRKDDTAECRRRDLLLL